MTDDIALTQAATTWVTAGLSTAPADRAAAEMGVREAYALAGLPGPQQILWFDSPMAGARAAVEAGRSVRAQVRTRPWAAARAAVHDAVGPTAWSRLWAGAAAENWRLVADRVATPLRTYLRDWLPDTARAVPLDAVGGQHDAAWLAAFDPAAIAAVVSAAGGPNAGGPRAADAVRPLAGLVAVARSAGWWWPYEHVAIVTERPCALHRDNLGRLHAADGPALAYPGGDAMHAWRGMPIPDSVVAELARLTADRIAGEPNAELRRVMLEHYGYERYLKEAGAQRLAEDECGVLWRLSLDNDEPLVMVEVVNSTPEPDGTSRTYWLRVPPSTRTAREGVAWTFGLTADEYHPLVQT